MGLGSRVLQTCKVTALFCISSLPPFDRLRVNSQLRVNSSISLPCPWRLSRQESHNGIVGLGVLRLLLDGEAVAVLIKLCNAITLGVGHPIAEDCGFLVLLGCTYRLLEHRGEVAVVEDVVAQHEAGAIVSDELLADGERLCESVGRGLFGILEADALVGAVTKQLLRYTLRDRVQTCTGPSGKNDALHLFSIIVKC